MVTPVSGLYNGKGSWRKLHCSMVILFCEYYKSFMYIMSRLERRSETLSKHRHKPL